jgi:peptidoglycan/LPS O-acetylase OafA/YrhL
LRYRRDIDGLRAVAVVPVILFHAGLTQVPGGFVGVDIFFVISGYLITSLIVGEMKEGCFYLATFYERRIRRIIPALSVVLAACVAAAAILFLPWDLKNFDKSLVATAFFVSNIQAYMDSGYFAAPQDTQPLLHTWSLAIEEQFYIVFPLVVMLAFRWGQRRWIWLVFALFILSLAASIWVTPVDPPAAFLLTPMRVWELMLGALLAAGILPRIESQALREIASLAGIALIAYAIFRFSSTTPFPGSSALIPCIGAALVIYAGEQGGTPTISKVLSLGPVVFLGLISYSLYLWHWPLLVFGRYWNITLLTGWQTAALLLASFVMAALSWKFVEQPFRRKQAPIPRRILLAGAATAMGLAVVFGIGTLSEGLPSRFSPQVLAITHVNKVEPDTSIVKACKGRLPDNPCVLGAPVRSRYAIWGDSLALFTLPAIADLVEQHGESIKGFVAAGCPALVDLDSDGGQWASRCLSRNARTIELLEKSREVQTVILMSFYSAHVNGARIAWFERQLDLTVDRLLAAGKTVVLVYPMPDFSFSVPTAVGRVLARGGDAASLDLPLAKFEEREGNVLPGFNKAGNSSGHIVRIFPHKRLCDAVRCLVYANGQVLYRDNCHLSRAGANLILPDFAPIFALGAEAHTTAVLADP